MGGHGAAVQGLPGQTLASNTPGFAGGNTQPDLAQRIGELMKSNPQAQAGIAPSNIPGRVQPGEMNVGNLSTV